MRPREREQDPPATESSPTPSDPPPRLVGNLSSMVVRPSENNAGDDFDTGDISHRLHSPSPPSHRHDSPLRGRRVVNSPPFLRRRGAGVSPAAFHRRDSPPPFRRRGGASPSLPASFRHPRSQRFHDNPGYMPPRVGSISPPPPRPRVGDSRYDPDFDHRGDQQYFGHGLRGGRGGGGGRFRDVSPHNNGFGRGVTRPFGRGYDVDHRHDSSPFDAEYVHRNDPNLSPREGDWICGNPRCGNLNFARRTHCNNCDQPRSAPGGRPGPLVRSPQRRGGYLGSPPPRGSPPGGGIRRRGFNGGYRSSSPARGWGFNGAGAEGHRDFGTGSPPPKRGGRFQDQMRRDIRLDYEDYEDDDDGYRGRGKFDWPVEEEWDRRGGGRGAGRFIPERRAYERRPLLPPRERWVRDRSRSPVGGGGGSRPSLLKGSYMMGRGAGRDIRNNYDNSSYMGGGRGGRATDSSLGRGGRGFRRHNDDSFGGRGRGDRRGTAVGRNNGDMY